MNAESDDADDSDDSDDTYGAVAQLVAHPVVNRKVEFKSRLLRQMG